MKVSTFDFSQAVERRRFWRALAALVNRARLSRSSVRLQYPELIRLRVYEASGAVHFWTLAEFRQQWRDGARVSRIDLINCIEEF